MIHAFKQDTFHNLWLHMIIEEFQSNSPNVLPVFYKLIILFDLNGAYFWAR